MENNHHTGSPFLVISGYLRLLYIIYTPLYLLYSSHGILIHTESAFAGKTELIVPISILSR